MNKICFLLTACLGLLVFPGCRNDHPPAPEYVYSADYSYLVDLSSGTTYVRASISRSTGHVGPTIWNSPTGRFSVNGVEDNLNGDHYLWQQTGYVTADLVFDDPGVSEFDHLFDAADTAFTHLPVVLPDFSLSSPYVLNIGNYPLQSGESVAMVFTQNAQYGVIYFTYDSLNGILTSTNNPGPITSGTANVQLSRYRTWTADSQLSSSKVRCTYGCDSEERTIQVVP